jgi:acyl transferase domain-containing protein
VKAGPDSAAAIAVIGWACRFPGADSPEALWQLLATGADPIRVVPPERWDADALFAPTPRTPGKMNSRWGGFLDDVDKFDADFFGVRPREACSIDPQQRLMLEVSWCALEDAGIVPARLAGSATGVFFGASNWDYNKVTSRDTAYMDAYSGPGTALSVASNRVSYALDFRGPSITVDTACSSALAAVHWACQSLRARESTLALAGGVNLILSPETSVVLAQARLLSSVGRSQTFDERADGYVRSEGCGVLVLKRLDEAVADGDRILGVVRGTAVGHNGTSNGLVAPNGPAQEALLRRTLAQAGVAPSELGLVEAHATGTPLGDLVEIRALSAVLPEGRDAAQRCAITAVKSNIGHTEAASGIAGVMRVLLSMQHGAITPNLHLQKLSPHIAEAIEGTPLFIPTRVEPWPAGGPRLAAVSTFGFGGANAQAILEQAPAADAARAVDEGPHALLLSARTADALCALARSYCAYLAAHPDVRLADVCFTAATGRTRFDHRLCARSDSPAGLAGQLAAFANGEPVDNLWAAQRTADGPAIVLELPSGDGARGPAHARGLAIARQWLAWGLRPAAEVPRTGQVLRVVFSAASMTLHLDDPSRSSRVLIRGDLGDRARGAELACLAVLAVHGADIDWRAVYSGSPVRRVALPTYPFQRRRYWVGSEPAVTSLA